MPYKPRLIQKKWQVLTRPYILYEGSPVIAKSLQVKHPCQPGSPSCPVVGKVEENEGAWVVYKETLSFLEVKAAVRKILYDIGLKKSDIQVVEVINHDYVITPLT